MHSDCQDKVHAGGETPVRNPFFAFMVVCPILLRIRYPLHNNNSTGNKITTIPAAFGVIQVISTRENEMKTRLPQQ